MQFQCDRCGKRYSTGQEIREGRAYRFKCRACGHEVIVRGPPAASAGLDPAELDPAALVPPEARGGDGAHLAGNGVGLAISGAEATPPPAISIVNPGDLAPPPDGYLEFRLESDVVTTQSTTITAALTDPAAREVSPSHSPFLLRQLTPPPAPPPPAAGYQPEPAYRPEPALLPPADPTPGLSGEARFSPPPPPAEKTKEPREPAPAGRRRLLVAAVALVPAIAVVLLFGGVFGGAGGPRTEAAQAAGAGAKTPGLLTPTIYVGPVTFESPAPPQLETSAPAPSRPARPAAAPAKAPPRREVASTRRPAPVARGAARAPEPEPEAAPLAPEPSAPAVVQRAVEPLPAAAAPAPQQAPPEPAPPAPAQPQAAAPAQAQVPAAAVPAPLPPPPAGSNEPLFAGPGYRRPAPVEPGCIERSVRIPQSLADRLPQSVMLRFAVARDGTADLVSVLPGADTAERIAPPLSQAFVQAVRGCRFVPGADESGRPARLWVMMRVRFSE